MLQTQTGLNCWQLRKRCSCLVSRIGNSGSWLLSLNGSRICIVHRREYVELELGLIYLSSNLALWEEKGITVGLAKSRVNIFCGFEMFVVSSLFVFSFYFGWRCCIYFCIVV